MYIHCLHTRSDSLYYYSNMLFDASHTTDLVMHTGMFFVSHDTNITPNHCGMSTHCGIGPLILWFFHKPGPGGSKRYLSYIHVCLYTYFIPHIHSSLYHKQTVTFHVSLVYICAIICKSYVIPQVLYTLPNWV